MGDAVSSKVSGSYRSGSSTARMIVTVAAAAAIGATAFYIFQALTATGDEPPIRVKRGSMQLELLASMGGFEPQNANPDPKKWKVKGFDRKGDEYLLYLAPKDPASCPLPTGNPNNENQFARKKIKHIAFLYHLNSKPDETHWVKFNAAGNKTRVNVDSSTAFLAYPDPKNELRMELSEKDAQGNVIVARGYIKEIHLGRGNSADTIVCTFADADGLDSVLIAEEP